MAKLTSGTGYSNATYTVAAAGAFDDRLVVRTRADLVNPNTWLVDGTPMVYSGMVVSVVRDQNENSNGVYMLPDHHYYTKYKYIIVGENISMQHAKGWYKIDSISSGGSAIVDQISIRGEGDQESPFYVHLVDGGNYE